MSGQAEFRAALLDAARPAPETLQDGRSGAAGSRFSVYRNNVVVSLKEAMTAAFPLVRKLIGEENFSGISDIFIRQYPPRSPVMMTYGADFPGFLASFEPLGHIGYLADAARLDLYLRQSYHAADHVALDPSVLSDPDGLAKLELRLAPSSLVLRSDWPIYDIWAYNTHPGAPKPRAIAQDVLITRPGFDPTPHLLPTGGADWLAALKAGLSFTEATDRTTAASPDFDLAKVLTLALETDALTQDQ